MKLKNTLEEAKFAVEVEDIGIVIVDGSSEGEVKARVAKKLKAGKEAIKSVKKITKDKAGKASKAIGEELPLYSDYAKTHKEAVSAFTELPEAKIHVMNPDSVYKAHRGEIDKQIKDLQAALKKIDAQQKKDPQNWGFAKTAKQILALFPAGIRSRGFKVGREVASASRR